MIADKFAKLRLWNCRDSQGNHSQYDMPLKVFIFDPRKKGRVVVAFLINGQLPVIDDSLSAINFGGVQYILHFLFWFIKKTITIIIN